MDRVFIIGSSGFIGSALCKHFASQGYLVSGCDFKNSHPSDLLDSFIPVHDTVDADTLFRNSVDLVINCAGSPSVQHSLKFVDKDFSANTHLTFQLLSALKESHREARFINLSSAAVYGTTKSYPTSEQTPRNPISPYGYHKYMAELICEEFRHCFNMKTLSARIFSAYGPGLRKQLLWDLWSMASHNRSIQLFGTGEDARDFIYVDDIVRAIDLIAASNFDQSVINIANGESTSIKTVAETFIRLHGDDIPLSFSGEKRSGDPLTMAADITALTNLGYTQQCSLETGLSNYLEWARSQPRI